MALLEVKDLRTYFRTDDGVVKAVDGVSFTVEKGKTLGIVGESGCGKSVTCLTIMGLNDRSATRRRRGEALLDGRGPADATPSRLREIRGNEIAMIFQDPMTSLNPVHSDRLAARRGGAAPPGRLEEGRRARARSSCSKAVGIPRAERRVDDYPHQFSGGMRQRVMIAMALINNPDLLIADEPTTALDVTTQAQILDLMSKLQEEFGTAIIMITHDLGVVAEIADDVVVMYAARGRRAGARSTRSSTQPQHPYTWGLLGSLPRLDADVERLVQIPGQPPSLLNPPQRLPLPPALPVRDGRAASRGARARCRSRPTPTHLAGAATSTRTTKQREAAKLLGVARRLAAERRRDARTTSSSSSRT